MKKMLLSLMMVLVFTVTTSAQTKSTATKPVPAKKASKKQPAVKKLPLKDAKVAIPASIAEINDENRSAANTSNPIKKPATQKKSTNLSKSPH